MKQRGGRLDKADRSKTLSERERSKRAEAERHFPTEIYRGCITKVTLGATRKDGGSRKRPVVIGGESTSTFYSGEDPKAQSPVVAIDVFDSDVPLPRAVKMHVQEVMGDPAAWARLAVERFEADLVTVHLISTDPLIKNASPQSAVKTVEQILQAVEVPLIIGGCGDPLKDMSVFEAVAEVFAGERLLFSSVTMDMNVEKCAQFIKKYDHVALAFTPMDLNLARQLNRRLYAFLAKGDIVMDLTTAALGYGLDFAFSNMERARLEALNDDQELDHPLCSGSTNAWAAREAWQKMGLEWEPRELRGPLWEVTTALTLLVVGVDLFMMMHPAAVKALKDTVKSLASPSSIRRDMLADWVTAKI